MINYLQPRKSVVGQLWGATVTTNVYASDGINTIPKEVDVTLIRSDISMGGRSDLYEIGFWIGNQAIEIKKLAQLPRTIFFHNGRDLTDHYTENVVGYLDEKEVNIILDHLFKSQSTTDLIN